MVELFDIIETQYAEYAPILKDITKAANFLYSKFINYEYLEINIISHLADGDGLASLILKPGFELIGETLGKQLINKKTKIENGIEKVILKESPQGFNFDIKTKRVMNISKDDQSKNSVTAIKKEMGAGLYIFSDLAGISQEDVSKLDTPIILEHHKPNKFNKDVHYINPNNYEINGVKLDGATQLSGSILSTLFLCGVAKRVKENFGTDKVSKQKLKLFEKKIDVLLYYGLAGGNADQQKATGLNKSIYDYLLQKKKLIKEDLPFFGHFTKKPNFVLAETNIPINLKYLFATANQKKAYLSSLGFNTFNKKITNLDKLTKMLFLTTREKSRRKKARIGINKLFLDSLASKTIDEINKSFLESFGKQIIYISEKDVRYVCDADGNYVDSLFDDYKDDVKKHSNRLILANNLLKDLNIDKKSMSRIVGAQRKKLKENIEKNLRAFSDPKKLEYNLDLMKENQYCILDVRSRLLNYSSIAELAHTLTALSKLGHGDLLIKAIEYELDENTNYDDLKIKEVFSKIKELKTKYNAIIHENMTYVENCILNGDIVSANNKKNLFEWYGAMERGDKNTYLLEFKKNTYLLSLDILKENNDINFLYKMTGVFGGLATKSRLLPNDYGILFTSINLEDGTMKISARINAEMNQRVNFGEFYEQLTKEEITMSGGGHPEAASCIIKTQNLDAFVKKVKEYEF